MNFFKLLYNLETHESVASRSHFRHYWWLAIYGLPIAEGAVRIILATFLIGRYCTAWVELSRRRPVVSEHQFILCVKVDARTR